MKNDFSISTARKDLPKMVREIQRNPSTVYRISVRNETVAELRSAKPMVAPGEAVRKLIQLREELFFPLGNKEKEPISKKVKSYLYGKEKR
jgi:hypothetical protein